MTYTLLFNQLLNLVVLEINKIGKFMNYATYRSKCALHLLLNIFEKKLALHSK